MNELDMKAAIRERDGFCCVDCGATNDDHLAEYGRQLSVHRTIRRGEYSFGNCSTICYKCHSARHAQEKIKLGPGSRCVRFRLPARLGEAAESFRKSLDCPVGKTALVRAALMEFLEARGLWKKEDGE